MSAALDELLALVSTALSACRRLSTTSSRPSTTLTDDGRNICSHTRTNCLLLLKPHAHVVHEVSAHMYNISIYTKYGL